MKKSIFLIIVFCFIFVDGFNLNAMIFSNRTNIAFDPTTTTNTALPITTPLDARTTAISGPSLETLIIQGAGYYLESQEYIFSLSKSIERSDLYGLDFYFVNEKVYDALNSVYNAWYIYNKICEKANSTPYNQMILNKLYLFDYSSFQVNNDLIPSTLLEVRNYLQKGDVRGYYSRIKNDLAKIYNQLQSVQYNLNMGQIPSKDLIWNLNQMTSKTLLFGQYAARVFYTI